jgi:hypothetical protein
VLIPSLLGEDINIAQNIAYRILRETFGDIGATSTEWWKPVAEAGRMSESTFYRARKSLVDTGKVVADSSGRGARYRPAGQRPMLVQGTGHD